MRARLLLTLALAVVFGALMVLVVYRPNQKETPKAQRLVNMDASKISTITIHRSAQDQIELVREGDHWLLHKPLTVRANGTKVRALLRFLDTRTERALDAKDLDLKNFGLAEPQVTVSFDNEVFTLGDANPLTAKRYILYKERVYTSTDSIYHDLLGEAASFASLNLLPEGAEPTKIILPSYTLKRDGAKWSITPERPDLTGDVVTGLVNAWQHGQAVSVKPGATVTHETKTNSATVHLEFAQAPAVDFRILAQEPELILERSDLHLEYHLFADSAKRLLQPQASPSAMPNADTTTTDPSTPE